MAALANTIVSTDLTLWGSNTAIATVLVFDPVKRLYISTDPSNDWTILNPSDSYNSYST
jgi:hypothetical protein